MRFGRSKVVDNPTIMKSKTNGTPVRKKVKHRQSANHCDCFHDTPDKNLERNYILSLIAKSLPPTEQNMKEKKKEVSNKSEKKQIKQDKNNKKQEAEKAKEKQKDTMKNKNNNSKNEKKWRWNTKTNKEEKDPLKRVTSITLRKNQIVPLDDGSGGCVLITQLTTITEKPSIKEESNQDKKEDTVKSKLNIFQRLASIKRRFRKFMRRKSKKETAKDPKEKSFTEFEDIPPQEDFIEECFQEDESASDENCSVKSETAMDTGRVSACSSGYFTPLAESPSVWKLQSVEDTELFEEVQSFIDGELFEDADHDSGFVDSVCSSSSRRSSSDADNMAVDSIKTTLDAEGHVDHEELRRRLHAGEPLYPNNDCSIWMRTCEEEIIEPIRGKTTGMIPVWLKGTLLRNGPGSLKVGDMTFQHLFDGSALLHRFAINDGEVTYQCRFLRSNTYLKNHAANRIVVNEFGTKAVPDPCQSIFKRVSAIFDPGEGLSDNAMISVYPIGDEFFCFTESPTIHKIDPVTLETLERVNVSKHVAVVNHTSHPLLDRDGSVYNQAMSVHGTQPHYSIVKFPKTNDKRKSSAMFESAEIMASVRARWPLHPSYMHTFGLTDRFYVIVEQPLTISVSNMVKSQFLGQPMCSCFRFFKDEHTLIHVIERTTGQIHRTYLADAFFYLHIVNQFEEDDHLVVDICCYSDANMLDCMYFEALKDLNKNPDYARLFRGRPLRFVLPLAPQPADSDTNLVTLPYSCAAAYWQGAEVLVKPELLCNLGCETPRINYFQHMGRPYRYFYAISSDADLDNPGTLIKVDTMTRTTKTWGELGVFPSEPIFVPFPDPQGEDDGVVLSALVWGSGREKQVGLVVLDAASWQELGRTVFQTPSPVPKCLHGWFTAEL